MTTEAKKYLSPVRITVTLLLSLCVSFFIYNQFVKNSISAIHEINLQSKSAQFWISIVLSMVILRAICYIWRLHVISDKHLRLGQTTVITFLWEFASAITPGAVGGAAVAIFLLTKEKIKLGKSAAIVLTVTLSDMVYLIILLPVFVLLFKNQLFAHTATCVETYQTGVQNVLVTLSGIIYLVLLACTLIISYGLFFNAHFTKRFFKGLGRMPIIKRWNTQLEKTGNDIRRAAIYYRKKSFGFWAQITISTLLTWTARFLLAICLIKIFVPDFDLYFLAFGRLLMVWTVMMLPITPGGVGIAEGSLITSFCDMVPTVGLLTISWRLLTYYLYILIGIAILPFWFNHIIKATKKP